MAGGTYEAPRRAPGELVLAETSYGHHGRPFLGVIGVDASMPFYQVLCFERSCRHHKHWVAPSLLSTPPPFCLLIEV